MSYLKKSYFKITINILLITFLFGYIEQTSAAMLNSIDGYQRRIRNSCVSNKDCPSRGVCENSQTGINGYCVCQEGFMIAEINRIVECLKIASTINDGCKIDEQCMHTLTTDAECRDEICQCRENTHFVRQENKCYKTKYINDKCHTTYECIGEDTVCRYGRCECPLNTHPNYDYTKCIKNIELGGSCTKDEECVTPNTKCNTICRCLVSHISSIDGTQCIKIAGQLNEHCIENEQCTVNIINSVCHLDNGENGKCKCKHKYHENNYMCFVSVHLNEICETDENCIVENSTCVNGRCLCKEMFTDKNGECSKCTKLYLNILLFMISLSIALYSKLTF